MQVILVNPPIRLPRVFAHYPTLSTLGLLLNAAWLRERAGLDVVVVDAFTHNETLRVRPDGATYRHVGAEVSAIAEATTTAAQAAGQPSAVVISVTMFSDLNRPQENLVPQTARAIRARLPEGTASIGLADLHVAGMNYFPYDPLEVLRRLEAVDWVLLGEGEPTLGPLLRRLEAGEPLEGLARVATRDGQGRAVVNRDAPTPVADLDDLPLPAFDLIDMERYFAVGAEAIRQELVHEYHLPERQLPLMTSRGCPHRCSFCTNQVLALPYRAHSVSYVRDAVRYLKERYAPDRILLLDDNINANEERFRALTRALLDEGVPWDAVNGYRADHLDE